MKCNVAKYSNLRLFISLGILTVNSAQDVAKKRVPSPLHIMIHNNYYQQITNVLSTCYKDVFISLASNTTPYIILQRKLIVQYHLM